jgi:hypothetical protein
MKRPFGIIAATVAALAVAEAALAGGMAEPVMEADVVAADAAASDAGILVPILFLIFLAAALSNDPVGP